jgi:hypothetical protein
MSRRSRSRRNRMPNRLVALAAAPTWPPTPATAACPASPNRPGNSTPDTYSSPRTASCRPPPGTGSHDSFTAPRHRTRPARPSSIKVNVPRVAEGVGSTPESFHTPS